MLKGMIDTWHCEIRLIPSYYKVSKNLIFAIQISLKEESLSKKFAVGSLEIVINGVLLLALF